MTEIERKALATVNEAATGGYTFPALSHAGRDDILRALIHTIEQHEAFRQEVSDAVEDYYGGHHNASGEPLARFIIKPPVDPLIEALKEVTLTIQWKKGDADVLRQALAARGLKITAPEQDAPGEEASSDFGVDTATVLYASLINPEVPLANPIDALRTALAAAEKRGIERGKSEINCHYRDGMQKARDWCIVHGLFDYESQLDAKFCRDLLGSN